jgi:hypothetical protein
MIKPLTLLVMLWILLAPAGAQETGDDGPSGLSARGLAELNANLMRIAEALESLQVDQRVLLTVRRVELAERRIAPLESRLQRARDDVRAQQEEIAQLESVARQWEQEVEEAIREGADPRELSQREELARLRSMTDLAQERLTGADRRVIEAEDEIAHSRRRIEILEELLEELDD